MFLKPFHSAVSLFSSNGCISFETVSWHWSGKGSRSCHLIRDLVSMIWMRWSLNCHMLHLRPQCLSNKLVHMTCHLTSLKTKLSICFEGPHWRIGWKSLLLQPLPGSMSDLSTKILLTQQIAQIRVTKHTCKQSILKRIHRVAIFTWWPR